MWVSNLQIQSYDIKTTLVIIYAQLSRYLGPLKYEA